MIIEIIFTCIIIIFVVIILRLAHNHNIHISYDASGLEAHPKEALKMKEEISTQKNKQNTTPTSLDKKTTD